ncbi:hypothetical protein POTOM_012777 [Populus tomentosa]|uniref:PH domain-containing protein n=1 Tax=Populus tomentosa TaxID=118781 RepID=A0A8X8A7N2_POPTO|nr:hypothetical protein POTOM_012777 [Populus tomentosa]
MAALEPTLRVGPLERDIELAITALKRGTQLLKYGRRGKPKFCPFRLSNDESVLIWISGKEEKHLKLSHVSRIIPGQRTPIFQRYPRPEKEYQSFSLIYSDRSLDLICKDKEEAEVWFTGLKALISNRQILKKREETRNDGLLSEANSPRAYTIRSSPLSFAFGSDDSSLKDGMDPLRLRTPYDSPPNTGLEKALSDVVYTVPPKVLFPLESACAPAQSQLLGGSDETTGRAKGTNTDNFRVSLSSAVSSSSQGSGRDENDALGDVYIWGEGTGDGIVGGGVHRIGGSGVQMDSFVPKALESAVLLDVQAIACGRQHAALVTKQGEVFSWGEELGGRLGHGVDSDVSHPKFVDGLKNFNVELVACGEYHSCAVTLSGDLYIWGGNAYNFGLLGCGSEATQWVPRKLDGPLEGIHVSSVSCGPWHTAVVTSAGQLFTFGDGTFGVLGHGDRISVSIPREVESLKGLRTMRAACGVWHTAAVVEIMVGSSNSSNCSSGKLFTWGDGDKCRLGHGDKEARLVPTCVATLVEPNFCQVACGQSLTAALTTTVLTSRTEVYTWGKGANGRLEKTENSNSKSHAKLGRNFSMESSKEVESISSRRNRKSNSNSIQLLFLDQELCLEQHLQHQDDLVPPRAATPTPTLSANELPKLAVDGAGRLNDSLREEIVKLRAQGFVRVLITSKTEGMAALEPTLRVGPLERDIELAITALKRGTQLLKYGRRGKPKFCPFRLSNDESVLIWISGKEEKHLKLSHVSRIIPGQRTPIFQRYPRPEKEYQSFSLIYSDRSLDLICKDKEEAEVWFTGLKALISNRQILKKREETRNDGLLSEANSPRAYTIRSSPLSFAFGSDDSSLKDGMDPLRLRTPYDSPPNTGLEKALSDVVYTVPPKVLFPLESACVPAQSQLLGGSDETTGRAKGTNTDNFRVSLSSAVSSSSQGSGRDENDALGDVYIWGEGTGDGIARWWSS